MPDDFTYMWNLKNNTNKQNRNRLIDTENRLQVARGDCVKKVKGWEVQIYSCKLAVM